MFRQLNFRSFFKFLSRNRLYTFINVLGLGLSLMFVVLIADFVRRQLTVDDFQRNIDRIYILANEEWTGTAYHVADRLLDRYPEIDRITGIYHYTDVAVEISQTPMNVDVLYADTTFFDIFSFELVDGDPRSALASRQNAVVSESFARRVFGQLDPIGQTIEVTQADGAQPLVVSGVMRDIDNSVIKYCDILTRFENVCDLNASLVSPNCENAGDTMLFIMASENSDLQSKTGDMAEYFKEHFWPYMYGVIKDVKLIPMSELFFSDVSGSHTNHGDRTFVMILISVGLLILVFAVINYINLTLAQTGFRAKEMATRRLLGSSRGALFAKLILESLFMAFVAFAAGMLLAVAMEPYAAALLNCRLDVLGDLDGSACAACVLLVVVLGVVSGVMPATVISNFYPIDVVRGSFRRKSKMVYGKVLIAFQCVITIVMAAGSLTMMLQLDHLIKAPLGYNTENIIDVKTSSTFKNYSQIQAFRDELLALPMIESVGMCMGTPFDGGNNNTISYGMDRMISFQVFHFDSAAMNMLGLSIRRDNGADRSAWYVNDFALNALGVDEDVPSVKMGTDFSWELRISGIVNDFHVRDILQDATAVMIKFYDSFDTYNTDGNKVFPWNVIVKVRGDRKEAYDAVCAAALRVSGSSEVFADYMDSQIAERYSEQRRIIRIMNIFTAIAIVISMLGLLAMSTYYIQQRRMEIAVRKVFGSTRSGVLSRLIGSFMILVGVAFVIAVPIIWWVMRRWLENYSYRISLSPLIFLAAGLFSAMIAFATVYWQSRRAADENPVESLKS